VSARRVVIVAYDDVQLLDVAGPLEVFSLADRFTRERTGRSGYDVQVVATTAEPLRSSSGLTFVPARTLDEVRGPVDTLIVAGGPGTPAAARDQRMLAALRRRAPRTRRVAGVCSGAFVLAAAGLLDGRHATTHWSECDTLARLFPNVTVETDPIYVRDGNIWTSAGVTAGIDLALALVDDDHGRDLALHVARWLVMFVRRPGGQAQFSAQLQTQTASRPALADLQTWIVEQPNADLSVTALAQRAAMSERNFLRVFKRETGVTPATFVERVRVETARRLLEDTALPLDDVARAAGFQSHETFRRAFHRVLGVAPTDYRTRFRAAS
jgi:transcriptional regulator GlxA family with amidase domain